MTTDTDLVIVGSGFGGSLLAMIARRIGVRVTLLERGRHPRFAIGESASPLAGAIIEQLAQRYSLPRLAPLAGYGPWLRAYPEVGRGLKRGFTYFKHRERTRYAAAPDRSNQLMVAASPSDELSDTHWLRADVDHFLVREAAAAGAEYLDQVTLEAVEWNAAGDPIVSGRCATGRPLRVHARAIVDASGPRGFLSRALALAPARFDAFPDTQALFSHFTGVAACADMHDFTVHERPPYPVDAAALHHVFDGGWMWVLRFDNGVTSAGIAVTDALARDLRLADGAPAWSRFLERYPSIAAQFAAADPVREFSWMPRLAWRASQAAGPRWAMLPSAAAFIDPLFSTGIPQTLLGVERLGRALEEGALTAAGASALDAYAAVTLAEADHTARFVAGCYAAFPDFPSFTAYAMFYFAAASFGEMSRRLNRPSPGFLCQADARIAAAIRRMSPAQPGGRRVVSPDEVAAVVERVNVTGLCDPGKRNWYGVDLEDTVRGAEKLGVPPESVRAMLADLTATGLGR